MKRGWMLASLASGVWVGLARAIATQDEIFKSINTSVSEPVDPTRAIAGMLMVVAVVVVAALVTNRLKKKPGRPATMNHSGRLLKEIAAALRLRPTQVRQLKQLAADRGVESPLTLLLCPSLRTAALKAERQAGGRMGT